MCPVQKRPFKPMAKLMANCNLHQFFGDGRLRVEKPVATMDDTSYTYSFLYTVLFFGEYQTCLRVLIDKIAYISVK